MGFICLGNAFLECRRLNLLLPFDFFIGIICFCLVFLFFPVIIKFFCFLLVPLGVGGWHSFTHCAFWIDDAFFNASNHFLLVGHH